MPPNDYHFTSEPFKYFNQWNKSLLVIFITHNLEYNIEEQLCESLSKIECDIIGLWDSLKISFYFSGKYTNLRVNNMFHTSLYKSLFI